ncbi:MAG: hypothetical protein WC869_08300 [Phycisphaerae bacterium]|jgi:hypothetical protein
MNRDQVVYLHADEATAMDLDEALARLQEAMERPKVIYSAREPDEGFKPRYTWPQPRKPRGKR